MKRRLSLLLLLSILCAPMRFTYAPALAEGEEIPLEEVVPLGDEGLTIQLDGWEMEEEADGEIPGEIAPATEVFAYRYAEVVSREAAVLARDGEAQAWLEAGSIVLVIGTNGDEATVAFNTERGVVTGVMAATELSMMSDEGIAAYMDAAARESVALYEGSLDAPLTAQNCRFPEAEMEAETEQEGIAEQAPVEAAEDAPAAEIETAQQAPEAQDEPEEEGALLSAAPQTAAIPAGFTLSDSETQIVVGGAYEIEAQDGKGRVIDTSLLSFESSDESVATVNEMGVVTALNSGEAAINVRYGPSSLTCDVCVPAEPASIRLSASSGVIGVKEIYNGLTVQMTPPEGEKACDASVTWSTSNAKCVKVNEDTGAITGVKTGSATITARTRNGKKATCKVTVKKAPGKVTLNSSKLNLGAEGMTYQLKASIPSGTAAAGLVYTSSDDGVVSVSEDGLLTTVGAGSATVTVKTFNGKTAKCAVTVNAAPAKVSFNTASLKAAVGQTLTLTPSVKAADGSEVPGALTFSLGKGSDAGCVSLNEQTGEVEILGKGRAVIEAQSYNGVRAASACVIDAVSAPSDIELNFSGCTIGVKEALEGLEAVLIAPEGEKECAAEVSWSSSNGKVAKVDPETGRITGVKAGSATITARTHNGRKATCKVTVKKAPGKVTLSDKELTLGAEGMTYALAATLPNGTASNALRFVSSDSSVLTVSGDGVITTGKPGSAAVIVETFNGKTATCKVTVMPAPAVVRFEETSVTLGEKQTLRLSAKAFSKDGGEAMPGMTYSVDPSSADAGCVKLNAATGEITGVRKGTAIISARAYNGVVSENRVAVTVEPAPTGVKLNYSAGYVSVGDTFQGLIATVTLSDGTRQDGVGVLTWTSSNTKVLKVDSVTGAVTGVKTGSAVVYAKAYNGKSASCKVTVKPATSKIALNESKLTLAEGSTYQLSASAPKGVSLYTVTYASSNEDVAVVSESGLITAVGAGSAVITAKSYNNKSAACKVTVMGKATELTFKEASLDITVGTTAQLVVNATDDGDNAVPANVTFAIDPTSASGVVKLGTDGAVKGLKLGTAYITATSDTGLTAMCKVNVVATPPAGVPAALASTTYEFSPDMSNAEKIEYLIYVLQSQLGKPYVYGGFGPSHYDCSGLVYYCYKQIGITLKDSAYRQGYDDSYRKITSISDLKRGDVVCFNTNNSDDDLSDHTSIYLGDGYFIHASSGSTAKKVIVSNLSIYGSYYNRNFSWGRRILE